MKKIDMSNEQEVIDFLQYCSSVYYNTGDEVISDQEYDNLFFEAQKLYPTSYFFSQVGFKPAERGAEVKHTTQIGGLDQVHEGEIDKWKKRTNFKNEDLLVTEKLDGSSLTLSYKNGILTSGYTRGDGITGADVTRHVLKLQSIPKQINPLQEVFEVRGEFIIKKENEQVVKDHLLAETGKVYKNLRGIVNGLINTKDIPQSIIPYLDFVAYGLNTSMNQDLNLLFLRNNGFLIPHFIWISHVSLEDNALNKMLSLMKTDSIYECDGIVLEYSAKQKRNELGINETNATPKYAFKWKAMDEQNKFITTVKEIEWNISKHGLAIPTVICEPVEHNGVTISRFAGFNAKFIKDNNLCPGAQIKAYRAGDVIPYIESVVYSPSKWSPPEHPELYRWDETSVNLELINKNTDEIQFNRVHDFFTSLGVEYLGPATLKYLFEQEFDTIESIIFLEEDQWSTMIGANGVKAYNSLHQRLQTCKFWELLGSWPYFGRGMGKRKAKAIFEVLGMDCLNASIEQVKAIKGFEEKSSKVFVKGLVDFNKFYNEIKSYLGSNEPEQNATSTLENYKFVFTGFRDAKVQEFIEQNGGEVQGGVNTKTTHLVVKDMNKITNKIKDAQEKGVIIITIDDLKHLIQYE